MTGRAVFLDRDGVLNAVVIRDGRPHPPSSVEGVEVLDGVVEACHRLVDAGWLLIVVTNQPDIARGTTAPELVASINGRVVEDLPISEVLVCPHDDADACACRKPAPGLLLDAADRWNLDLRRCVMVGDRWRDVEAGAQAGTATVFIDRGYAERQPDAPDVVVDGLPTAADQIIARWGQASVAVDG